MTDDPTAVVLQWSPASGPEYVLGSGGTVSLHRIALDGGAVWAREIKRPAGEQSPGIVDHENRRALRLAAEVVIDP